MGDVKEKGRKWRKFRRFVDRKIIEAGGLDVSGVEKFAEVSRAAAVKKIDALIAPGDPLLELGSDVLIQLVSKLISGFIQNRVEKAKRRKLIK